MQGRRLAFVCLVLAGIALVGAGVFFLRSDQWGSDRIEILKEQYVESDKSISENLTQEDKINLNDADRQDLIDLPGIGEKTTDKIIQGRPYQTISEVLERKIISNKVFEEIKDKIAVW